MRRRDLEPNGVECIWVELTLRQKHVLFGVFYRPPSADALYFSSIEDSIHLAVDTGINDIIITGDFNYNMLNAHTSNKIKSICEQFSLTQTIDNPTHFTEHSSSLIDIILTNNETNMVYSGVGDPFLNQEIGFIVQSSAFLTSPNQNLNHIPVIPGHTTEVTTIFFVKKLQIQTGTYCLTLT